ncbi:MAG TPA: hypothetical protein DCE41_13590 [Cytophagales bacterium]|nr:hypothetical protein [Cytophagales bacterium]
MKFYTTLSLLVFLLSSVPHSQAQISAEPEFAWGIRGSLHVGVVPLPGQDFWSGLEFRLSSTAEYRYPFAFVDNYLSGLGLAALNFYYRGLGNYNDQKALAKERFSVDAWLGPGLIGGWGASSEGVLLVHNHANWALAMGQPYRYNLLVTTRGVIQNVFTPKFEFQFQRIGTASLSIDRFQMAYSNDGGPVLSRILGDGLDRWWTGSFSLRYTAPTWLTQVSYDRFTGFRENAFEWSNLLGYKAVLYDESQARYNRGQYRVDVVSTQGVRIGGSLILENFDNIDLQNILHLSVRQAFHPTFNPESVKVGIIYEPTFQ